LFAMSHQYQTQNKIQTDGIQVAVLVTYNKPNNPIIPPTCTEAMPIFKHGMQLGP
jgi:hypothetical protein